MRGKYILFVVIILVLSACGKQSNFKISGDVADACGETIYLEETTLLGVEVLDSVVVNRDGKFAFVSLSPEYPNIYRLRMGNKQFLFPVDSCERISIETSASSFDFPTDIEGSEKALQMQELRRSVVQLQKQYRQTGDNVDSVQLLLDQIEQHKQNAKQIIVENPRSIVAYYALYQKIGDLFLFTPYDKEDRKYFGAVATAFHTYMPQYDRTQNIYNWVLDAMKEERNQRNQATVNQMISSANNGFLDIVLPDVNGAYQKMSSLVGEVFLLDFSLASVKDNVAYTFELRELYNKYHAQGFQIYQVSVDLNRLLWEDSVRELPWITVMGTQAETEKTLQTYNVTQVPTTFLFDKTGEIVGRDIPFDRMDKVIKQLLAQ